MKTVEEILPASTNDIPVAEPNLREVINNIPDDYRPPRPSVMKGMLYYVFDIALYLGSLAGMIYGGPWLYLPCLIVNVLSIGALFIVAHDCCHGSIFGVKTRLRRSLAYLVGQSAMLTGGHMWEVWGFGHNRVHHGHTVKAEFDFVWHPVTPQQYAAMNPLAKLWHNFCWSPLGHGAYYLVHVWIGKMWAFKGTGDRAMRLRVLRDKALVAVYHLAVAVLVVSLFGWWVWVKAIVVPFLLWHHYIGFVVYVQHIHEMVVWRVRQAWTPFRGQVEGTVTFVFPKVINFLSHNIFIHTPHHVDMRIPFYHLPRAMDAMRQRYSDYMIEHPFRLSEYLRSTRLCKFFDFELSCWFNDLNAWKLARQAEQRPVV